ncbi:NrdR family transcriptional regulator [Candidatus Pelagibacter sp.]|uniref:NrdR family transcriptional regulator n=1 Tax=Candidatus Pelagibacter sp. TaxID=2024849 RepID=UPI003F86D5DF
MLCPKCKKIKSNILNEKFLENKIVRERNCPNCDFSFTTNEKIVLLKKQKPRPNKLFMNYRFYLYGQFRLWAMLLAKNNLIEKAGGIETVKKKYDGWYLTKTPSGKNEIYIADFKSTKKGKITNKKYKEKPIGKKETIELILSFPEYWNYKKYIFKNLKLNDSDIEIISKNLSGKSLKIWKKDFHNQNEKLLIMKTTDEIEDFHKSVSHYLKKKENEYNQDFYKNYKVESIFSPISTHQMKIFKDWWNNHHYWSLFLNSR